MYYVNTEIGEKDETGEQDGATMHYVNTKRLVRNRELFIPSLMPVDYKKQHRLNYALCDTISS